MSEPLRGGMTYQALNSNRILPQLASYRKVRKLGAELVENYKVVANRK